MEILFFTYNSIIFLLISQYETTPFNNPQQSSPQTKYTIEPPLRSVDPSNNLPLIEA